MSRSANFLVYIPFDPDSTFNLGAKENLLNLREYYNKLGTPIKWYKYKNRYAVYFRGHYTRKPKRDLAAESLAQPQNEVTFTTEQLHEAFS